MESGRLVIDRPKGSTHPRYPSAVYPVDYGCLQGIASADGGDLDVWVGTDIQRKAMGVVCTVDLMEKDAEAKVLLGCTEDEVAAILASTNVGPMRGLLIRR